MLAPAQHRAYTYKITAGPATNAVSLCTFKLHIKKTTNDEDTVLGIYLRAAIDYCEKVTKRDLITRTYTTFRDSFPGTSEGYYMYGVSSLGGGNIGFELRRSPLQSITSIKYLKTTVLTTVATTVYYNTVEDDYSEVLTNDGSCWPTDADRRLQTIEIVFKSGFGDDDTFTPTWATEGILLHATEMYKNRGDCSCDGDIKKSLPSVANTLYLQNRIENL